MKKVTDYPDVNQVLELLSEGLQKILGDQLVGLYLTGSLTYGDFNHDSSDIDFLAVHSNDLSEAKLSEIKDLHKIIAEKVPHWAKSLEGSYIPIVMLDSIETPLQERPYVNGGKVSYCQYGNEWVINLYALQECGLVIYGSPLSGLIPKVTIDQVREASKKDLLKDWVPKITDPDAFNHPLYDSEHIKNYAVLTMCRILHRANNDNIASKKIASKWVKKQYPQWEDLIDRAEAWKHGKQMGTTEEVQSFMRFTQNEVPE